MDAFRNHILANLDVRAALLAGDTGALRDWYNTHDQGTRIVPRKLNRDGLLEELGLTVSVEIIARLRAFAAADHPWAIAVAELVRLIDGGSGPDFGDTEIRIMIVNLKTGVPTEFASEQLPALVQVITESQAEALLALPVEQVTWAQHFLQRDSGVDDFDEILRPVRQPGSTLLLSDVANDLE